MVDWNATVTKGPLRPAERRARKIIVPELTGMLFDDARIVLEQAGFGPPVPRFIEAYAPNDSVVAQQPIRGQLVDSSLTVELSIARSSWVRFLPQIYQETGSGSNGLLREYMWVFQQVHDQVARNLEKLPHLFRPLETDPRFLDWLGSWIALQLESDWPETKKRKWLKFAPALYSIRGTKAALSELLEMYVGVRPEIRENEWPFEPFRVGVTSEIGVTSTILPPMNLAHCFVVNLPMPAAAVTDETIVRIHRVIQTEKPAHTTYFLTFQTDEQSVDLQPFMTIGEDMLAEGADSETE